mgnify:CR=1 FL=1
MDYIPPGADPLRLDSDSPAPLPDEEHTRDPEALEEVEERTESSPAVPPPLPTWAEGPPEFGGLAFAPMAGPADPFDDGIELAQQPKPVGESERHLSLDVVRGIAVLGVLWVNIQSFGLIDASRRMFGIQIDLGRLAIMGRLYGIKGPFEAFGYETHVSGGDGPLNYAAWWATMTLADTKFIAIFSMLFGAGCAVLIERHIGVSAYYRRMLMLMFIGCVHGYLMWHGDILFLYGAYGLALFFLVRMPPIMLAILGMAGLAHYAFDAWSIPNTNPEVGAVEIDLHLRDWLGQFDWRLQENRFRQMDGLIYFVPMGGSYMLIGAALYRDRFLTGGWKPHSYVLIAFVSFLVGVPWFAEQLSPTPDYSTDTVRFALYWSSQLVTVGWMALGVALAVFAAKFWFTRAVAAVGRMALTNYLMHTVICSTIFFGHAFGQYEHLDRATLMGIVLAIWVFQLVASPIWLRYFRFGPVEWFWRSATYLRWQPLLRTKTPTVIEPSPVFGDGTGQYGDLLVAEESPHIAEESRLPDDNESQPQDLPYENKWN